MKYVAYTRAINNLFIYFEDSTSIDKISINSSILNLSLSIAEE